MYNSLNCGSCNVPLYGSHNSSKDLPDPSSQELSSMASFNMAAESKKKTVDTNDTKGRSILNLHANGSNVQAWETAVNRLLQMSGMTCLLMSDYCMSVDARKTLALDLDAGRESYNQGRPLECGGRGAQCER